MCQGPLSVDSSFAFSHSSHELFTHGQRLGIATRLHTLPASQPLALLATHSDSITLMTPVIETTQNKITTDTKQNIVLAGLHLKSEHVYILVHTKCGGRAAWPPSSLECLYHVEVWNKIPHLDPCPASIFTRIPSHVFVPQATPSAKYPRS